MLGAAITLAAGTPEHGAPTSNAPSWGWRSGAFPVLGLHHSMVPGSEFWVSEMPGIVFSVPARFPIRRHPEPRGAAPTDHPPRVAGVALQPADAAVSPAMPGRRRRRRPPHAHVHFVQL